MSDMTEGAISAIAELGERAEKARIHTLSNGKTVLMNVVHSTPDGCKTVIEEISPATTDAYGLKLVPPDHIARTVPLQKADSLVDYTNRFSTHGALIYADIANNRIVAILDDHEDASGLNHAQHRASLTLPFSEEWKLWTGIHDKWMDQLTFARFLRENGADIKAPDAATLAESVKDLQAVRNVNFTKAVRLNSDNESFEYTDETKVSSKGALTLPDTFLLQIPVYFGGRTVEIGAFLRWALVDTKLTLGIQLHRAEHVRQAIFAEVVEDIANRTNTLAVYGGASS